MVDFSPHFWETGIEPLSNRLPCHLPLHCFPCAALFMLSRRFGCGSCGIEAEVVGLQGKKKKKKSTRKEDKKARQTHSEEKGKQLKNVQQTGIPVTRIKRRNAGRRRQLRLASHHRRRSEYSPKKRQVSRWTANIEHPFGSLVCFLSSSSSHSPPAEVPNTLPVRCQIGWLLAGWLPFRDANHFQPIPHGRQPPSLPHSWPPGRLRSQAFPGEMACSIWALERFL